MKLRTNMFAATVTLLVCLQGFAGAEGRGGGQGIAGNIKLLVNEAFYRVYFNSDQFPSIDLVKFAEAIETTNIVSTPHTYEDIAGKQYETDATNYPAKKLIEISEARFSLLNYDRQLLVVFHEYLGVMGLEGKNYNISNLIIGSEIEPFAFVDGVKFKGVATRHFYLITRVKKNLDEPRELLSSLNPVSLKLYFKAVVGSWGTSYLNDGPFSVDCKKAIGNPETRVYCTGVQSGSYYDYNNNNQLVQFSHPVRVWFQRNQEILVEYELKDGKRAAILTPHQ